MKKAAPKKTAIRKPKSKLAMAMGRGWRDHQIAFSGLCEETAVISQCGRLIVTRRKAPDRQARYEALLHNRKQTSSTFIAYGSTPWIAIKGAIAQADEAIKNLQSMTAGLKF